MIVSINRIITYSIVVLFPFFLPACNSIANNQNVNEINKTGPLDWQNLRDKFPNKDALNFEFTKSGKSTIPIDDLPIVDSHTSRELILQARHYTPWIDDIEMHYYSLNKIDGHEVGIFLQEEHYAGLGFSFVLIEVNESGGVSKCKKIASYWLEDDCMGYTNSVLNTQTNKMTSTKVYKCTETSLGNEPLSDSLILIYSLKDLSFETLEVLR